MYVCMYVFQLMTLVFYNTAKGIELEQEIIKVRLTY